MKMRVAMIGCGAVASVHAASMARQSDVELAAVCSPEREEAARFAARFGVPKVVTSLKEAIAVANVAIICSPSAAHFEQAKECLYAGCHVLSELPPCNDLIEAEELGAIAQRKGALLGCAHTSRYLEPYARIQTALSAGRIGEIQEVSYVRYPRLRPRAWADNALMHHAAHPIDLVLRWCGVLHPVACSAFPNTSSAQSVSVLATLPSGRPFAATISYGARMSIGKMVVVGTMHTVETDGFTFLHSDLEDLHFLGDEREVYERAIMTQDMEFIGACQGKNLYISWAETEELMRTIHRFEALHIDRK